MLRAFVLVIFFGWFTVNAQTDSLLHLRIDDREEILRRNALPPGPARISGTLRNKKGDILKNRALQIVYAGAPKRKKDLFYSNEDGRFQLYIFRENSTYFDVEVLNKRNKRVIYSRRFEQVHPGGNYGIGEEWIVPK